MGDDAEVLIDVDDVADSLRGVLGRVAEGHKIRSAMSGCIHKVVSPFLRGYSEGEMYAPKLVSIGPYHHGNPDLAEMEDVKLKYLSDLIQRSNKKYPLESYTYAVWLHAKRAREEYSDQGGVADLGNDEFVKMMMVDGCFILELLIKWYLNDWRRQVSAVVTRLPLLRNDLLLVENQIPFFILEELYKVSYIKQSASQPIGLPELILTFFTGVRDYEGTYASRSDYVDLSHADHLLHLYHASLIFKSSSLGTLLVKITGVFSNIISSASQTKTCRQLCYPFQRLYSSTVLVDIWTCVKKILLTLLFSPLLLKIWRPLLKMFTYQRHGWSAGIPNASYLRETGFKFKKKYATKFNFLDVSRSGNTISIPTLHINENMLILFKNLLAFEQCSGKYGCKFTAYATFMANLIDTTEDIDILKACGIVDNRLGDDQKVADFFNNLRRGIYLNNDEHYLFPLFDYITKYYTESYFKIKFYGMRKKFVPDYFTNPWAIPSMIAAFILLGLSALQTFYAVYPYYHPRSNC